MQNVVWLMKNKSKLLALLALLFILIVAADLRLFRVDTVPGWYNDEGTYINLAVNLLKGRAEYFGVQGSMLFPARMPLFIWLLALVFRIFGTDITVLRILTGSIGVINTALIYFIFRNENRPLALVCALAFAIFPKAILYSRLGFSYNLLAMLALILFWACNYYLDTGLKRYAIIAALVLGLCLLSELVGVAYIPVFIIVILWKRWKDLWFTLPLAFLPFVIYTLAMLWISPQPYWADLQYVMSRVSSLPLPAQFVIILLNSGWIHQDLFFLMGVIGIFLYPSFLIKKRLAMFLILPFLIITRTIGVGRLGWYYLIPLFPFYAIGLGQLIFLSLKALLHFSIDALDEISNRLPFHLSQIGLRLLHPASNLFFITLFIITPFFLSILFTHIQIKDSTYKTDLEPLLADVSEAQAVVNYLNSHSNPEDVILVSPSIGWALKANAVDYHISLAYMGLSTTFFPNNVSHNRFRFNPEYAKAKYIVIDNLWKNWGEQNLSDLIMLRRFAESFRVVFKTSNISIYQISE